MKLNQLLKLQNVNPLEAAITQTFMGFTFLLFATLWSFLNGYFVEDIYLFFITLVGLALFTFYVKKNYDIPAIKKQKLHFSFYVCFLTLGLFISFLSLQLYRWSDFAKTESFIILWIPLVISSILSIVYAKKTMFLLSVALFFVVIFFLSFPEYGTPTIVRFPFLIFSLSYFLLGFLNFKKVIKPARIV